tara:strand:- start:455 stop:643 length:189 start_codon:yes stop_codon:yes gene_type:complete
MAKKRKVRAKGKKAHKPSKSSKKFEKYAGGAKRSCPKCGPGVFLAIHKDRVHCGKCSYTEKK